jgi:cell division protein FtsL
MQGSIFLFFAFQHSRIMRTRDKAQKREIQLEQDYARLKLEQARLANHKLIKVAAEKQHLLNPVPTEFPVFAPYPTR